MEQQTIVELKDIRKEFPGVVALDKVNMQIQKGRVHALVGENGAGKSTLMKILSGTYTTYGGQILYEGKQIHLSCEKDAFKLGISIVAQELNCIEELTIEENLYLGREPRHNGCFLDKKKRTELTQKYLDLMGLELDPATKMGELSIAQRQMVEILKSISRNCRVIILDEPTSVLTSVEAELLFRKVKELKAQGIAFVFISHRLEEVFELCEDYTVLRDGKCIESGALQDVDQDRLISLMVGREIENIYPKLGPCGTEVVLEGKGLTSRPTFHDVSFQIHKGEILGFAGMVGAGRSEVARTVFGLDALESGEIWLDGKPCRIHSTREAIRRGIAMVTEDRGAYGFAAVRSIRDNIVLPNEDMYSHGGFFDNKKIVEGVKKISAELGIKAPDMNTSVGNLSGGNQQKVVLAKWLVRNLKVLILDEPTRGIDVGARQEIYRLIVELAQAGMTILLISSDMPEVLSMSHRVMVLANGRVAGELSHDEATQNKVMKMIVEDGAKNENSKA